MIRAVALAFAFALLAPAAAAEMATLDVTSAQPVALDGTISIVARGGSLDVYDPAAAGEYVIHNATGTLRAYTVRALNSQTQPRVVQSLPGTLEEQEFVLDHADVTIALSGERFALRAASLREGAIVASGPIAQAGLPHRLSERVETDAGAPSPVLGPPETVPVRWDAGWFFVGAYDAYGSAPLPDFPAPPANVIIGIEGGVHLHAFGGVVSFAGRTMRTGNWSDETTPGADVETRRDIFFEGTVGEARIGAGPSWGLGAPDASWRFDGDVAWRDASGAARANGTAPPRAFEHADVRGRGTLVVRPDPPGLVPAPARYDITGDWSDLHVGGDAVVERARFPVGAAVAGGSILLALLLAARAFAALYTRLASGDLLAHPQRARIFRLVEDSPGVHLRELHRRAGGGWGAFRAHLRLLQRGGYVRVERGAHYALVFPTHVSSTADRAIPHPLARALYDALPADGSAVPLRALRDRLGTTRQLLNYHAQRLEEAGLVRVREEAPGRRAASRSSSAEGPARTQISEGASAAR